MNPCNVTLSRRLAFEAIANGATPDRQNASTEPRQFKAAQQKVAQSVGVGAVHNFWQTTRGTGPFLAKNSGQFRGVEKSASQCRKAAEISSGTASRASGQAVSEGQMDIKTIPIGELSADPSNVRVHTEAQIEKLMGMLRRWGQTLPLLIDSNRVVRVGNARLDAARRLGWTEVKVLQLDLPPSEWTALAIADNKSHDDSSFDQSALAQVLASLQSEGGDLAIAAGYSPDELAQLLGQQSDAATAAQPPADFPIVDENIETEHECPKCKYRWSGSSAPAEDDA